MLVVLWLVLLVGYCSVCAVFWFVLLCLCVLYFWFVFKLAAYNSVACDLLISLIFGIFDFDCLIMCWLLCYFWCCFWILFYFVFFALCIWIIVAF